MTGWIYHERLNPFGQTGPVRLGFSAGNTSTAFMGRGWSSYGIGTAGWGSPADVVRRQLIVAYHSAGRREEALALEQREDAGRRAETITSNREAPDALIPLLREAGLFEDAERRRLAQLERDLAKVTEEDAEKAEAERDNLRGHAWDELGRLWKRAGDEQRTRAYAARLLERADAHLAKIEADEELDEEERRSSQAAWHRTRAKVLVELAGDLEQARVELAHYFELLDPDTENDQDLRLAWLRYRLGEVEPARRIFQAVKKERSYGGGYWSGGELEYGLGLCHAADGELEAARPLLRRALVAEPKSEHAPAARAALD